MKIKIRNNTIYYFFLVILIILAKNGFYLWQDNDYIIQGLLKYSDLGIIIAFLFTCYVGGKYKLHIGQGIFDYYIIIYFILACISSVTAWAIFGQSLFRGFFAQRVQIFWLLSYFPIRRLLQVGKINKDTIVRILYFLAFYELGVCTIQYILGENTLFLNVMTGSRNYMTRYYFNASLLIPISLWGLYESLNKRNILKNILLVTWTSVFLLFFAQYRSVAAYYFVGCLSTIAICNKGILKKIIIILFCGAIFFLFLKNTFIFDFIIQTIENGVFNDSNMVVRNTAREHYLNEVSKSFLVGRGYPSVSCYEAFAAAGYYNYMYFTDNGIFGFIYSYGLIGLIWCVLFWLKISKLSWRTRNRNTIFFAYTIFFVVGIISDFSWFWSATFVFVVVLCLLEDIYNEQRKGM